MHQHQRSKAMTLIELLAVLGILVFLAALTYPAFESSKRASKVVVQVQKLRAVYLSTALYRSDYDGDAKFGTSSEMGFPLLAQLHLMLRQQDGKNHYFRASDFESGCDWHSFYDASFVWPMPETTESQFFPVLKKHQSDFPFIFTLGCSEPGLDLQSPYVPKLFLGSGIEGRLIRFVGRGPIDTAPYWMQRNEN